MQLVEGYSRHTFAAAIRSAERQDPANHPAIHCFLVATAPIQLAGVQQGVQKEGGLPALLVVELEAVASLLMPGLAEPQIDWGSRQDPAATVQQSLQSTACACLHNLMLSCGWQDFLARFDRQALLQSPARQQTGNLENV